MTPSSNQPRLIIKFQEQIRFMQRSCQEFDSGNEKEAIRIAQALRIIFHDTQQSTSLVHHLGFETKRMLSSTRGLGDWRDYLSHKIDFSSSQPITMLPILGSQFHDMSIQNWWNTEPIFIHESKKYTRRMIVLSAANKDGGAHVDGDLEKYYEVLCAGEYAFGIIGSLEYEGEPPFPQGVTIYPKNAHLALIRQFGHEVLGAVRYFAWVPDLS